MSHARKVSAAIAISALVVAVAAQAGDWSLATVRDPATYRNVAVLSQASATPIDDEYALKKVQPTLEFRCEPGGDGSLHVRIDWQRFISSFNTEVIFAADDAATMTVKLGVDKSNKITSTKAARDDQALLDYLRGHEHLTVKVTPYSAAPVSIDYDLTGLNERLGKLKAACEG